MTATHGMHSDKNRVQTPDEVREQTVNIRWNVGDAARCIVATNFST